MHSKAVDALADYMCREHSGLPILEVHAGFDLFYRSKAREYLKVAEQACKEEEEE